VGGAKSRREPFSQARFSSVYVKGTTQDGNLILFENSEEVTSIFYHSLFRIKC
jgi:hypothetical protein